MIELTVSHGRLLSVSGLIPGQDLRLIIDGRLFFAVRRGKETQIIEEKEEEKK